MMICRNCGQENDDKEKICIYCHAKLKKTSEVDLIDEDEDVPVSPGNDPSLQGHTHNYLVIIAILCVVIGVTGWLLLKENTDHSLNWDLQGWINQWFHHEPDSDFSSSGSGELVVWEDGDSKEESNSSPQPDFSERETSSQPENESSEVHPIAEADCEHATYVYLDEYNHRCTRCGRVEEHILYVEHDAVYCRRCDTLKEYITHEEPDGEDLLHQRLMTVVITGNYLNIRSGPGEEYEKLADESMFYRHQYVDIYEISYDGMWGRVQWEGIDGWIYLFYTNGLNELG